MLIINLKEYAIVASDLGLELLFRSCPIFSNNYKNSKILALAELSIQALYLLIIIIIDNTLFACRFYFVVDDWTEVMWIGQVTPSGSEPARRRLILRFNHR